ncbi:KTSC domain-containing protein [Beijerinckia sp. L45]|uniref:KTSC domain-containing protein n=1 Tax=Beijerinckia sp. L45 TaxID=1641855 RepID=UPI00131B77EA|nr:KTSC domain-containing protein [Beijerinckia sp. L45]
MPEMTPVKSSNIKAVGYDDAVGAMHVTFKSGSTYAYAGVEKKVFHEAMDAASVGKFVATEILPKYKAEKLEAEAPLPFSEPTAA